MLLFRGKEVKETHNDGKWEGKKWDRRLDENTAVHRRSKSLFKPFHRAEQAGASPHRRGVSPGVCSSPFKGSEVHVETQHMACPLYKPGRVVSCTATTS